MTKALHSVHRLAHRILELERTPGDHGESDIKLAVGACAKIQIPISKFAGPVGYQSLLSRALALAAVEGSTWQNFSLEPNGVLKSRHGLLSASEPQASILNRGEGVLLTSNLLMLLETFIGEQLLLTLLSDAWPDESFEQATSFIGTKS